MKFLKYLGKGQVKVIEKPVPVPGPEDVLVRVCCSALCGSERAPYLEDGPLEFNTGHEFTGVIEDPNGSTTWKKGDRVTVHVTVGCGHCEYCREGMQQFCKEMRMVFDGHAEYVAVPERSCIPIPDDMSQQEAVLLSADTIGVAYRAAKQIKSSKDSLVLITGAGPVGLGAVVLLKFMGYPIMVSEPQEYRRDYARKLGADIVVDPLTQDLEAEIMRCTNGHGVESIIECSGNEHVQLEALRLVRCMGTVVFAGENPGTIPVSPSGHFTRKEMHLTGVWYQSDSDFAEITELFRRGLNALPIISHEIGPERLEELTHEFFKGNTAKVVINWSPES